MLIYGGFVSGIFIGLQIAFKSVYERFYVFMMPAFIISIDYSLVKCAI